MGDIIQGGLTSRHPGRKCPTMPYTLQKTLEWRGHDPLSAPGKEVLEAVDVARPEPPSRMPCMNPTCLEFCEWREGAGRPPNFCNDTCRQQHEKTRKRLVNEIAILVAAMEHPSTTVNQRKRLSSERSKRSFALVRYPDVRGSRSKTPDKPA